MNGIQKNVPIHKIMAMTRIAKLGYQLFLLNAH
jgi:hypothetical protein